MFGAPRIYSARRPRAWFRIGERRSGHAHGRGRRLVALKVLRPDLGAALGAARVRREITFAAALQHPHIVPVLDSGEVDGTLWFAMPFVDGETLRARLDRDGRLPPAEAVRVAREVALALDYAHQHGVLHRDVKPENILFSDGQALVADFGIAKALTAVRLDTLTRTDNGFVLGTPAYMAPEQAVPSAPIDERRRARRRARPGPRLGPFGLAQQPETA